MYAEVHGMVLFHEQFLSQGGGGMTIHPFHPPCIRASHMLIHRR